MVDEIRISFGETAKKGIGSFGYYCGFLKGLNQLQVREIWREAIYLEKRHIELSAKRIFWHRIGELRKNKKVMHN